MDPPTPLNRKQRKALAFKNRRKELADTDRKANSGKGNEAHWQRLEKSQLKAAEKAAVHAVEHPEDRTLVYRAAFRDMCHERTKKIRLDPEHNRHNAVPYHPFYATHRRHQQHLLNEVPFAEIPFSPIEEDQIACLIFRPASDIIFQALDPVTVGDLHKLVPPKGAKGASLWLNNTIIDVYLQFMAVPGVVRVMDTTFYPSIREGGVCFRERGLMKEQGFFQHQKIIIPVHMDGNHWVLVVVTLGENPSIYLYDSIGNEWEKPVLKIKNMLANMLTKMGDKGDILKGVKMGLGNGAKQSNSYDCGVFMCQTARAIAQKLFLRHRQTNMPYLRKLMILEIANGKLMKF